jgi:putative flippase GtrA
MSRLRRFARYNTVAALGIGVQLLTIAALIHTAGVNYVTATAAGVTTAVAHNFVWHVRWTWRDRTRERAPMQAFVRFAMANGAVSLVGNIVVMTALVGLAGMPPVPANLVAIAACGLINFELGDRLVFRRAN